jgi:outer membrane receptor protein involved in Fe transport
VRWNTISGLSNLDGDEFSASETAFVVPFPPFLLEDQTETHRDIGHRSIYSYAHRQFSERLLVTLGGSLDSLDLPDSDTRKFNPKLGMEWQTENGTTIRAAAFRTLLGPQLSKQTVQPRLEPTHVVGFNQYFFGGEGELAESYNVGLSRKLAQTVRVGAEISSRDIEIPVVIPATPFGPAATAVFNSDEQSHRAYLYWNPSDQLAFSSEFEFWHFDNHGEILGEGFMEMKTRRLPLSLRYFGPRGLKLGATASYVAQRGQFEVGPATAAPGSDRFWIVDATMGFRLPGRRGTVELSIRNLFDTEFQFQDIDPENPRLFPERFVALRFSLSHW